VSVWGGKMESLACLVSLSFEIYGGSSLGACLSEAGQVPASKGQLKAPQIEFHSGVAKPN